MLQQWHIAFKPDGFPPHTPWTEITMAACHPDVGAWVIVKFGTVGLSVMPVALDKTGLVNTFLNQKSHAVLTTGSTLNSDFGEKWFTSRKVNPTTGAMWLLGRALHARDVSTPRQLHDYLIKQDEVVTIYTEPEIVTEAPNGILQ